MLQEYLNHELSDWLNRIGLLLGFFSFWLAAPEFIGEERLRGWEKRFAAGLENIHFWVRTSYWIVFNVAEDRAQGSPGKPPLGLVLTERPCYSFFTRKCFAHSI